MATKQTKSRAKTKKETPFEDVIARLDRVVGELEKGDLSLEDSLAMFEEGIKLARQGSIRLDEAETRVEELLADGSTQPLEDQEIEA